MGVRDLRPGPNGEPPEIFTNTPMVKKAREGVMEFLLINHPLDCPICDQGGECDLQDQAMAFGVDSSRYQENKRAVEDKYIGPLVKTVMNRCIHCTRCVRFTTEVAGISELGLIGRGEDAEITTYLEQAMTSELQGNVIDLCPVGALTSKPYAFHGPSVGTGQDRIDRRHGRGRLGDPRRYPRPRSDAHPAARQRGDQRRVDFRQDPLHLGRPEDPAPRPALCAQGRQAAAGDLGRGLRRDQGGRRQDAAATRSARSPAISPSVEEMYALKLLMQSLGSENIDCRQDGAALDPSLGRASYIFNPTIEGIEQADALLIIGANPRFEASVLNARIRKRWRKGDLPIGVIGEAGDLRYDYEYLGAGTGHADGSGRRQGQASSSVLKKAKRPLIIVGQGALARADGAAVLGAAAKLARRGRRGQRRLERLCRAAHRGRPRRRPRSRLRAGRGRQDRRRQMLGEHGRAVPARRRRDRHDRKTGDAFVVYIGTHGDAGAHRADVILPAAAYTEKSGT